MRRPSLPARIHSKGAMRAKARLWLIETGVS
jgi:hypothetical protein